MNLILFDHPEIRQNLLPFTFTRPVAAIRTGILTIAEKWERHLDLKSSFATEDYLAEKFPIHTGTDNLWINGAICPTAELTQAILNLALEESLVQNELVIATRTASTQLPLPDSKTKKEFSGSLTLIDQLWKIYQQNGAQIREDFMLVTAGRKSAPVADEHTRVYNASQIFLEEGARVRAAVLNAENGPIYLGKNSFVQEGALIRGPFALCEESHVNMGAKVRGDTTVGPFSKIGGEVSNSVIFGYSNKAHDGFLGNSVLGEWCNIGADTNTSNMKNNYENIKLWSYAKGGFKDSGLMFCGLMFGDHSKCGINTMFNSGTVVGVSASIFGDGYPRNFIPSFAWGGAAGFTTYQLNKALETAGKAMERRNQVLTETEKAILKKLFDDAAPYRVWEKKS
ncbi:MAG: glucose-1-phosphate thymidylyltransferase [Bacteroidota bacterium]|nr:MAG: sugar phosphate nucleotidyl transferase [Bacteroidetes bacterium OLB12]GIL23566.1 MAG: glucose-1-phosphate thymidylyltransferase [Bacteroidota bacterium]HNT50588.1 GlmU family protein [Cyclobacteriaceae bacterium]